MIKRRIITVLIINLLPHLSMTQDINYAKEVVHTLASVEFKGRGYVDHGDKIAADYISDEFEKIGLLSFKKNYFQRFITSVNTFPSAMELSLNDSPKTAGVEFLIDAGSPGIEGEYEALTLEMSEILNPQVLTNKISNSEGKFIIVPAYKRADYSNEQIEQIDDVISFMKYHPDNPAAGLILLTNDKLTWGGSTLQYSKPSFTVVSDSTLPSIERVSVNVENKYFEQYKSQNVVGYLEGEQSDSLMVLIAHYDHLGMMGSEALFPGANDNASGIAMLLNLARYYNLNQPKYNTVFIAFGGEELGLLGAKHFVENPLFKLANIKFLLNFDISGTGDDGIEVVNGKLYRDKFDRLVRINAEQKLLAQVKIQGEACNSDHCMFHMNDVPCFFIYTLGGIQAYHDIYDKAETLPLTEFEDYFRLVTEFIKEL